MTIDHSFSKQMLGGRPGNRAGGPRDVAHFLACRFMRLCPCVDVSVRVSVLSTCEVICSLRSHFLNILFF